MRDKNNICIECVFQKLCWPYPQEIPLKILPRGMLPANNVEAERKLRTPCSK